MLFIFFFFFQAEDGIRDLTVTGVQTCALPIYHWKYRQRFWNHGYGQERFCGKWGCLLRPSPPDLSGSRDSPCGSPCRDPGDPRSEEHTSELQSQSNLVCRLLLEKKNNSKFNRR